MEYNIQLFYSMIHIMHGAPILVEMHEGISYAWINCTLYNVFSGLYAKSGSISVPPGYSVSIYWQVEMPGCCKVYQ